MMNDRFPSQIRTNKYKNVSQKVCRVVRGSTQNNVMEARHCTSSHFSCGGFLNDPLVDRNDDDGADDVLVGNWTCSWCQCLLAIVPMSPSCFGRVGRVVAMML